jgi:hypothetical protein
MQRLYPAQNIYVTQEKFVKCLNTENARFSAQVRQNGGGGGIYYKIVFIYHVGNYSLFFSFVNRGAPPALGNTAFLWLY